MRKWLLVLLLVPLVGCQRNQPDTTGSENSSTGSPDSATQQKVFTLGMRGEQEVPGPGDADGFGSGAITLDVEKNQVCFELQVKDIQPASSAHIHSGKKGASGDIVITLEAPTSGTSKGCVDTPADVIQKILASPADYYVNVHNAEFPDGALRAQLA